VQKQPLSSGSRSISGRDGVFSSPAEIQNKSEGSPCVTRIWARQRSADWQSAVSPNGIRQDTEIGESGGLTIRDTAECQSLRVAGPRCPLPAAPQKRFVKPQQCWHNVRRNLCLADERALVAQQMNAPRAIDFNRRQGRERRQNDSGGGESCCNPIRVVFFVGFVSLCGLELLF